ncbi:MAG: hypothetical protein IJO60_09775 [Agathobacter sp.]|nr:hypothetical protein [Agathobacter sp.]
MKKFYQSIRKMGKVTVGIVAIAMIFGFVFSTVTVSAATESERQAIEDVGKNTRAAHLLFPSTYDGSGNYYTGKVFDSLAEAKASFGYNYTYKLCYKVHNGMVFNHYYSFSNGTRCYFIVD